VKMFDADKTRMIVLLPYREKTYDNMLSRFHLIPERHGRTDGRTVSYPATDRTHDRMTDDTNDHTTPPTLAE